jgi:hypothetical protein
MSDESDDRVRGPVMLAATNMLKPPPPVIGSLNKEITLPRTIKLTTLAGLLAGAVFGFVCALAVVGPSLGALMWGPTIGGALGWGVTNFSPLEGESLAKWLGLQALGSRKRKLELDGRQVRLYVGIAPLRRTAAGAVRMLPGGVPVDAVRWDQRGVPQQEIPGAARLTATGGGKKLSASSRISNQKRRSPKTKSRR